MLVTYNITYFVVMIMAVDDIDILLHILFKEKFRSIQTSKSNNVYQIGN